LLFIPLSSKCESFTITVELPLLEGVTLAGWSRTFFIAADAHNKFAERNHMNNTAQIVGDL